MIAPGWSAELQWPDSPGVHSGTRSIPLVAGEADFLLARLDSVPPGSTLVFTYGPTVFEQASWLVSLATQRWIRRGAGAIADTVAPSGRQAGPFHVVNNAPADAYAEVDDPQGLPKRLATKR